MQAFVFAADLNDEQRRVLSRQFGGRRYGHNWAVRTLKADIEAFHADGVENEKPSFYGMRKRFNEAKNVECIDRDTGEAWWPEVSKEAFADGVKAAVDGYWRWQKSRAGTLAGRKVGFPRMHRKGRSPDRYTVTTGFALVDRRHVWLPKLGKVRLHENARRLERLVAKGTARILAMTVRRSGTRILVSCRVELVRPQVNSKPARPGSCVGVDVGVRRLATVADDAGNVVMRVPNPKALAANLSELRRLNRQRARRTPGSSRYRHTNAKISGLHARVRNVRHNAIHHLSTDLAKTHGRIVVEGLDAAGMMQQKGLPGARARRRGLADAALAETRRQLRYKCGWYGSELVEADRFFPSSKTCSKCGHVQDIGWAEHWVCDACGTEHQRDDCAAVNLARWSRAVSPVGAAVKRGANRKTRPRRAGGVDTRKPALAGNPARGTKTEVSHV